MTPRPLKGKGEGTLLAAAAAFRRVGAEPCLIEIFGRMLKMTAKKDRASVHGGEGKEPSWLLDFSKVHNATYFDFFGENFSFCN